MSLRHEWQFQFTAGAVYAAATERGEYHRDRLLWWTREQDRVAAEAEKATVSVRKFPVTDGERVELRIDDRIQRRLNECSGKIQRHLSEAEDYEMWADAFSKMHAQTVYMLDPDDVRYFNLAGTVKDEKVDELAAA